ncbi:hypothetical protein B224_p00029 (plasmid) [Aeromonas media WS]|nr:hypothetical protein B224_p00029 [Aeromonas media WS]
MQRTKMHRRPHQTTSSRLMPFMLNAPAAISLDVRPGPQAHKGRGFTVTPLMRGSHRSIYHP